MRKPFHMVSALNHTGCGLWLFVSTSQCCCCTDSGTNMNLVRISPSHLLNDPITTVISRVDERTCVLNRVLDRIHVPHGSRLLCVGHGGHPSYPGALGNQDRLGTSVHDACLPCQPTVTLETDRKLGALGDPNLTVSHGYMKD